MRNKRKVCFITGTRAEYGLLCPLMEKVQQSLKLDIKVIATGMHLSPEFGSTYKEIHKDGYKIDSKIEMLLSSDSDIGVIKSMGLGLIGFADALSDINPDIVVILGDRFESFSAAIAATVLKIPIVHLYGGETTEGAYDESFRHSITKMSHMHFTSAENYRNRVIQLGEHPDSVFNVGYIGIDNIRKSKLLSRLEFERSINFKLSKRNLLITFHPVTLESSTVKLQFSNLLNVIEKLKGTNVIFTKANADNDGRAVNRMIDEYVDEHKETSCVFDSLGRLRYLSAMQYVDGVVGNSSSGLTEAPSFKIGTINIGDRQKGRIRASSVIDCTPEEEDINSAIKKLYSLEFSNFVKNTTNPFGSKGVVKRIINIIESNIDNLILKKSFYDLKK